MILKKVNSPSLLYIINIALPIGERTHILFYFLEFRNNHSPSHTDTQSLGQEFETGFLISDEIYDDIGKHLSGCFIYV